MPAQLHMAQHMPGFTWLHLCPCLPVCATGQAGSSLCLLNWQHALLDSWRCRQGHLRARARNTQLKQCMQAAEAEKKAAAAQTKAADGPQLEHDEGDDLDPNQYHEMRLRALETARSSGRNPYPHKFHLTMYIPEYVAKYKDLEPGTKHDQAKESLAGNPQLSLSRSTL